MSSTEDAVSQDDSPPFPSAQPRDGVTYQLASLNDERDVDLSIESSSTQSSNLGARNERELSTHDVGGQPEQSPHPNESTPPVKKISSSRPNKYHGPPSTWRDWTAPERQLAASLDQLQAKDLSIHLYNFFQLKKRVSASRRRQCEKIQDAEANVLQSGKAWLPFETWTAWPMVPELVPRVTDESEWEADAPQETKTGRETMDASEVLQDLLAARICKKAKERFLAREWEDSESEFLATPRDPCFSRQIRVAKLAGDPSEPEDAIPVVMADDQRAKAILQPSLNHVVGKLDILFTGLHHARSSYATYNKAFGNVDSLTDEELPKKKKRKTSLSRPNWNETSNQHPTPLSETLPEESDAGAESSTRQRHYRMNRRKSTFAQTKLGLCLRDWSDVLGVASMCGWSPEIVARAAARCSDLFEEGITFRTLHEGHNQHQEKDYLPDITPLEDLQKTVPASKQTQDNVKDAGEESVRNSDHEMVGGVHVDGFRQPIKKHKSWGRGRRTRSKGQRD